MKIALKIVAVCMVAMILITALSSYLIARREFQRIQEQQQADAQRVADLIRESVDLAYQNEGHQGVVQAIRTQTLETGQLRYRWVWFDVSVNDPNRPVASLDSLDQILAGKMDSVVSKSDGRTKMHTYFPMDVNEDTGRKRKGAIEVSDSLETAEQEAWRIIKTGLGAITAMTVFCLAFVTWAGVGMIGRPLTKLIDRTRDIGNGFYRNSVAVNSNDEFGELSVALNNMAAKISDQQNRIERESAAKTATMEQLRHADRLKTVGRLAAGIAHEIGTPLNVVSGRAGLIHSGKLTPDEIKESAAAIQSESNRIAGIVRQLMDFARHNAPKRLLLDVQVLIERTMNLLQTFAAKRGVTMQFLPIGEPPFTAFFDDSQIQQVLTNLIVNATQAMPEGGEIVIKIENVQAEMQGNSRGFVQIDVLDEGVGMDETTLDQVFEPFFTTKEVGQGTGLGLSIAHGIIEEHGGRIEVDSKPGTGTQFLVLIPKTES